jgi:hypothetical protein
MDGPGLGRAGACGPIQTLHSSYALADADQVDEEQWKAQQAAYAVAGVDESVSGNPVSDTAL